jgi:hypothetical protein
VLDALHVTLIGVLVGGPDGDDTLRAWHFELEVGVVGDCHELGVAGMPKDGVLGSMEPDHLEGKGLLPEVRGGAKVDGQVDPPNRFCPSPWHDTMEALDAGSVLSIPRRSRVWV